MSGNFLDSNILVYLFDETDERKREIAAGIVDSGIQDRDSIISFQVVQETLNVLTRKVSTPMAPEDTRHFLRSVLVPLWKVYPSQNLYYRTLDMQERYGYSFYDSLIVASALEAGCRSLYTEDMQHGQEIEDLTIVNPFL